ncbi:reverse transcriptase domain-containing protein [Tanacetum coccineum]
MADNRTMAELLQAPTEGYEDAIVIPEINANFELKHGLINLVQNKQFFGHDKEDPHAHIRYFNKITSTMRFPDVPSTSIKLMLFPFSLEGSARIWLEKEPPRSILTWDDLVSKFINQFFPPSKTTNLRNEITRFQQRFDESFYEAWDRFNDLLRACPHHGFSELHQLDTFYNALNANDQDSLNSTAGGNFLDKMPRECLRIIESKSKVRNSRNKAVVVKVSSSSSTPGISPDVAALTTEVSELKNMMKTMLIDKQKVQAPVPVKVVEQSCVTYGGAHSYRNCPATDGNVYRDNIQEYVSQAAAANFNQGNTNSRPPMVANQIRPPGFPPIQNNQNRFNQNQGNNFNQNRGTNFNQNRGNNFNQGQIYQPPTSQPPVYQVHPYQAPAPQMQGVSKTDFENYVKANDAVLRNMQNQGQGLQNQMTNLTEMLSKFVNSNTASTSSSGSLPSNTITNPKEDLKGITTRSGVAYQGPTIPTSSPKVVERRTEVTKDTVFPTNNGITEDVQPPVVPVENQNPVSEPVVAPVSAPMPNPKPSIPYPSRRNDEKRRENANEQKEKFYEIFKDMSFEISFMDALTLMPKFASTLKALIGNKEKLSEMARTPLNEHCSAVILNKLPEKLGDPGRFLIPCKFPRMDECLALADLGASINLMPFSMWKKLNLPNLTPTCMTLELADRSISRPIGIAKDVNVKVGVFQFPADFVTSRTLIDVYEGELTLRVDNEAITYNLDQTSRYSVHYNDMTVNRIDVVELAYEEYSQEVLEFSDVIASGNPTPEYDLIVSNSSSTLTPFGVSDFLLLDETGAFLALADDPTSLEVDESYYDLKGDFLILEALLNSGPLPPPNQGNYLPEIRKELKICKAKTAKSSIDEPPEVKLKDLPPHLEYAFLEDNNKLPVIIANDLSVDEKTALIKVLKSRKRAIAWKLSDIKGINPEFCSHKILMEEDYEPAVQHQRRVNTKIHNVIKKEVEKLLDARLIYPISDIPWVSPVHCVPKKGGMTVVTNDENELVPTRLVTRWRVCIDYRKLNEATRKDHFPLPFMDQMLERLVGNEYYCFLDGFSGYFQIPIDLKDQEKTTFTCPYGTFAYRRMPFGLCNALGTFQRCMMAIFHDMIEKTMENRPLFYFDNDDDEYTVIWRRPKAITPDEPSEKPEDPLIMGEEELSTIPEKDKFCVVDLVPIPSEVEGIFEDMCDVPVSEDPSTFDALNNHSEILSDSNNDGTSSDDDSYENIEYVEASPLNLEYNSLEKVDKDQEKKEFDLEDIFQIQDVILREKLLNISRLITNIESLKDNPVPNSVLKSPSLVPISVTDSGSIFEESDTSLSHLDNSLPEFKTFSDHTEETRNGSTTTHANNSLPEYDSFLVEVEPDQGGLTGIVISDNSNNPLLELPEFESFHFDPSFPRPPLEPPDVKISLIIETDAPVINNFDELNEDECFDPGGNEINVEVDNSFIFVTWTFLPFITYPEVSPLPSSTKNEDTIFDPGIST